MDFGCGGGYLLKYLDCKKKVGIEINPTAIAEAQKNGVEIFQSVDDVPAAYADVVISHHALEHTENPLKELQGLHRILRAGGKAVIIVPCESIKWKYRKNDLDHHLFTWSPMCMGNLMTAAGFNVIESKPNYDRWFKPFRSTVIKLAGMKCYNFLCYLYGHFGPLTEVKVIAEKM
jgi:SAM-dependent methyltransferase